MNDIQLRREILIRKLASEESLTQRKLTAEEAQRFPLQVYEWHMKFNTENLEAALAEPAQRAQNKNNQKIWDAKRCWAGGAKSEESSAAMEAGSRFCEEHPQLIRTATSNALALCEWLQARSLAPTYEHFRSAYEALVLKGALILDPSAIGAGPETEVTGYSLAHHPNLHLLLEPIRLETEAERQRKLSASEFLKAHPELQQRGLPPMISADIDRAVATFTAKRADYPGTEFARTAMLDKIRDWGLTITVQNLEAAYDALLNDGILSRDMSDSRVPVEGGGTRIVDLGGRKPGFPTESEKYSFKMLVRSLISQELRQRCQDDPSFKSALDNLDK